MVLMRYQIYLYYFTRLQRIFLSVFLSAFLASALCVSSYAQQPDSAERKVENPIAAANEERKPSLRTEPPSPHKAIITAKPDGDKAVITAKPDGSPERPVEIESEEQDRPG